jgi:hypothetical protein
MKVEREVKVKAFRTRWVRQVEMKCQGSRINLEFHLVSGLRFVEAVSGCSARDARKDFNSVKLL